MLFWEKSNLRAISRLLKWGFLRESNWYQRSLFLWTEEVGVSTIQKAGNYGGAIHLCISRGSFCWAKWKLSKTVIFWVITAGVIKNIPQISPKNEINLSIRFYTLRDCNFAQNVTTIKQEVNWIYPIKAVAKIFMSYTT